MHGKLCGGIKIERGMAVKKKNLEKAVILGLLLSTGVYGTAWASAVGVKPDGTEVELNESYQGGLYIDKNYTELGDNALAEYETVKINVIDSTDWRSNGIYLNGYHLNAPDTDFDITINNTDTAHGIYIGDNLDIVHNYLKIGSYKADINAFNSDAFKISAQVFGDGAKAVVNNDFNAIVEDGNGINISASRKSNAITESNTINEFYVKGNTKITINGEKIKNTYDILKPSDTFLTVEYNPAAVYAGDTECYFEINNFYMEGELNGNPIELPNGGDGTYGVESVGKAKVDLSGNVKIETNCTGNYGIYAGKNGEIHLNTGIGTNGLNSDLVITANGENSIGITAQNSNLIFNDTAQVHKDAYIKPGTGDFIWIGYLEGSVNEALDDSINKGSIVIMNGENNTITMAEGGKALYADAKNSTEEDAEVIIKSGKNGIGTLDVKGDIVATNSGKIDLDVRDVADITGDIEATNGGTIDFTLGANANMIVSSIDNQFIKSGAAANSISLMANDEANTQIGNVQAANGGVINITLGAGAYFAGRVDDYKDADGADGNWNNEEHKTLFDSEFAENVTSSGTINMTLNGGVWNLTQQSWATTIDSNGGTIYLDGEGTGGYAVHIGTLTGNDNTFVVNLNPDDPYHSDMIYIYDSSQAAQQNLVIHNADEVLAALPNDGDRVRFATLGNPNYSLADNGEAQTFGTTYVAKDYGVINSGFSVEYVDYDEDTDNGKYNGNNVTDVQKPGEENIDAIYGDIDTSANAYLVRDSSKDAGLSDAGKTIINMSRANYKNAIYMDRLNKRLGEARYINGEEEQGMWVRLRHDRIGMDGEFRSQNTMYELGYDVKQECDNGERRLGFAVDYMDGSTSYSDIIGKGETKRYGLWLYDTWLGDKGHYADYVLKWGHLQNDFDIKSKTRFEDISGDYSNNVFSVSAEYGKKNDMGNNWYFEPQAQLQLARVTGAEYESTQNTKVSVDGINSLIGRAGFRLGRDLNENSTVYVKADLLHEFLGDQTITATDTTGTFRETFENKGTWYDVGFGFATAVGKNSYAFMDFEKSFGNDNDETYQINAGVQWTF